MTDDDQRLSLDPDDGRDVPLRLPRPEPGDFSHLSPPMLSERRREVLDQAISEIIGSIVTTPPSLPSGGEILRTIREFMATHRTTTRPPGDRMVIAPDVMPVLRATVPAAPPRFGQVGVPLGIPIVLDEGMEPGTWEIRDGDRVLHRGRLVCCDLHNANCEPPSELCCRRCTEVNHPQHPPGVRCTWLGPETGGTS